jgi:hypothetical protein
MRFDVTYLRIKRANESDEECFLYTLENELENKYVDTYLSELVMDSSSRQKIIENKGFCNHHFYKLLSATSKPASSDGHGIALVNKSLTEAILQDLSKPKSPATGYFNKLLATEDTCPACIHFAGFTKMHAEKLVALLSSDDEELLDLLKKSGGFCIPHLVMLIHAIEETMPAQSQKTLKLLIENEEKNLRRLNSELAEYIKRQSYELSEKDRTATADVVLRSIEKIAGRRGIKGTYADSNSIRR